MSKPLSQAEVVRRIAEANPDITVLGSYKGLQKKLLVSSKSCGHQWEARPDNLINRKSGCPECKREVLRKQKLKSNDQWIHELSQKNPSIEALAPYKGDGVPLLVACKVCGHQWKTQPNHLLHGHGCPRCAKTSTSFMEQFLYHTLAAVLGTKAVRHRDRKAIGMELDIFLPDLAQPAAIEIGSWRFHRNKIDHDIVRAEKCRAHGIRLLSIFDQFDEDASPFETDCWTLPFSLGQEKDYVSLKALAREIHSIFCLPFPGEEKLDGIICAAEADSKILTPEQFREEMRCINPTIEVIGEYVRSNKGVECRCSMCGSIWYPTPANLRQGHGCRTCATQKQADRGRMPHEEYVERLKESNPNLTILDRYVNSSSEITVQCKIHGCISKRNAHSLLSGGYGCPECKKEALSAARKKSHRQFVDELVFINPEIEVLGHYEGSAEPIKVRCRACHHVWSPTPNMLQQKRGCPECSKKKRKLVRRWTPERFDDRLKDIHPSIVRLDEYENANTPTRFQCQKCNHIWTTRPSYLIHGSPGCPHCRRQQCKTS